jgi:hypothetical protein
MEQVIGHRAAGFGTQRISILTPRLGELTD